MSGPLIKIPFVKANACGNDFLIIQRPTAPILDNLRTAPPAKK